MAKDEVVKVKSDVPEHEGWYTTMRSWMKPGDEIYNEDELSFSAAMDSAKSSEKAHKRGPVRKKK